MKTFQQNRIVGQHEATDQGYFHEPRNKKRHIFVSAEVQKFWCASDDVLYVSDNVNLERSLCKVHRNEVR